MVYTHQVNHDVAKYSAQFNVALNRCSNVTKIEAKFLFKENLWAKIVVQVINCYPSGLKNSKAAAQRAGIILKHAGKFKHTKRK